MTPRVAITGVGAISALGVGAEASFSRLLAAQVGVKGQALQPAGGFFQLDVGLMAAVDLPSLHAEVPADAAAVPSISRTEKMSIIAIQEAMTSAGLGVNQLSSSPCGLVWGTTTGGLYETEVALVEGPAEHRTGSASRLMRLFPISGATSRAAAHFGCFTHQRTICSACSSGAVAIALGATWIQRGLCERVLVGGADALCGTTRLGFGALGLLDPEGCRPFDPRRGGLVLGEGAAALVLEAEGVALERAASVHAWLDGWAVGAEAFHMTQPEPQGATQATLMRRAMARAGVTPEQVDYVAAHGTGTLRNDETELRALDAVFGLDFARPRVSSNKAQVGHTLGASGALSAVFSALAMRCGQLPPNPASQEATHPALVAVRAEEREARVALVNAFGFGGMDAVLCLTREGQPGAARAAIGTPTYLRRAATLQAASGEDSRKLPERARLLRADRSRRFDDLSVLVTAAVEACVEASERSADAEIALVHGSAFGLMDKAGTWLRRAHEHGPRRVAPAEFPLLLPSAASGNASVYLGLRGLVAGVSRLEASAHAALHVALDLVSAGETLMAVSCAAEPLDAMAVQVGTMCFGMQAPGAWCAGAQLIAAQPLAERSWNCRVDTWGESGGAVPPPPPGKTRAFLGSSDGSLQLGLGAWGVPERAYEAHPSVDGLGGCGAAACLNAIEAGGDAALLVDVVEGRVLYSVFLREVQT